MLIDYRVYCSLYAVLLITYLFGFPMVMVGGGKHFKLYAWSEGVLWAALLLTNYLDWLWS